MAKIKRVLSKESPLRQYWMLVSLALIVLGTFFFWHHLSLEVKSVLYTVSTVLKNILIFLLPFLVLPYIFNSLSDLKDQGALLIILILLGVAVSTFAAIIYGYGVVQLITSYISIKPYTIALDQDQIFSYINLSLPSIPVELSLVLGAIAGIVQSHRPSQKVAKFFAKYQYASDFFFAKLFTPILPLYILGFLMKIAHDGDFGALFHSFKGLFLCMIAAQIIYIFGYFLIGSAGFINRALRAFKNAMPAFITGFSSISSMVTLPVTLQVAYENTKNFKIADLTIPTTVNCHAVGDAIGLTILSLCIYYFTNGSLPDFSTFVVFAGILTLAQSGAVSVAGGSVIIIVPYLQKTFGFTPEMIGLITAISVFIEPWGTGCNILGNSGYVIIVERLNRLVKKVLKKKAKKT
jgi:Na+/H+-dicarboxylate symporter